MTDSKWGEGAEAAGGGGGRQRWSQADAAVLTLALSQTLSQIQSCSSHLFPLPLPG